jgi:hypothetical protein
MKAEAAKSNEKGERKFPFALKVPNQFQANASFPVSADQPTTTGKTSQQQTRRRKFGHGLHDKLMAVI